MCLLDLCIGCGHVVSMVDKLLEHAVWFGAQACCEACQRLLRSAGAWAPWLFA